MKKSDVSFSDIPDAPGVYSFCDAKKKILYVGKATSLRDRIKSYFIQDLSVVRSPLVAKVIDDAVEVVWEETDSVLEALILEAKRIKQHSPVGNTREKDNKSFNYVGITDEKVPRVLLIRGRELSLGLPTINYQLKTIFGPFPAGKTLKEALKVVRKIFPFYDTKFSMDGALTPAQQKTVAFNRSIGLFPEDTGAAYRRAVRHIELLFDAQKEALITKLEKEMHTHAKAKRFEDASRAKKQLFALRHIQDISLIRDDLKNPISDFRVEAYDVAHLRGDEARGVMVVIEDGEVRKDLYRVFTIKTAKAGDDIAALKEVIERRALHKEWHIPHLVVIDGGRTHLTHAKKALASSGMNVPVVAVVKDERHRPKDILGEGHLARRHEADILLANAEAHRFSISRHRLALRKKKR